MSAALEQITQDAMALTAREKLALAQSLMESVDGADDSEAGVEWEREIQDRIAAIDGERVARLCYEDVMRAAEARLNP